MIDLFHEPRIEKYDIIAVQEPWRNRYNYATYCPRDCSFVVVDSCQEGSRVCIFVNKRLPLST
jgi:hypothetical protein